MISCCENMQIEIYQIFVHMDRTVNLFLSQWSIMLQLPTIRTYRDRYAEISLTYALNYLALVTIRWEVVDTTGGMEGGGEDGWVWNKIVCKDIIQATADFPGVESGILKVCLVVLVVSGVCSHLP